MTDEADELVVRCDCGFELRGSAAIVVPAVQEHGRQAHNMDVTREEVLALAERSGASGSSAP